MNHRHTLRTASNLSADRSLQIEMPGIPLIFPSLTVSEKVVYLPQWTGPGDGALLLKCQTKLGLYVFNATEKDILFPMWISVSHLPPLPSRFSHPSASSGFWSLWPLSLLCCRIISAHSTPPL